MTDFNHKKREKNLSKIYRYKAFTDTMFYRPNLLIHTKRVSWITQEISEILKKIGIQFDWELAKTLAIVHDDAEIITGDIIAPQKARFTKRELEDYENKCKNAINILTEDFWKNFWKYNYKKLLLMEEEKNTPEYFIVKYADKLDAHCEVCHEILSGNTEFTKEFEAGRFWKVDSYDFTFKHLREALKNLLNFINISEEKLPKNSIIFFPEDSDFRERIYSPTIPSKENIDNIIWYYPYDFWKKLHKKYWNIQEIEYLI